jgi:predicted  nucleic acid-binding Zn ribbon protein
MRGGFLCEEHSIDKNEFLRRSKWEYIKGGKALADFYKMTFTFKNNFVEDKEETLFDYLSTLYKNGQTYSDYQLVKKDHTYVAYLTVPDKNALDPRFNSTFTNKYLHDIETELEHLGENIVTGESCCCNEPSWYMLYTDFTSNESPIVCGDCGHGIPLYKVQHIMGEEGHFSILSWQKVYKSIDNIWIYCLSDRFSKRQLSDPDSQLSRIGMDICAELEKVLKKPVYYFLYQPGKMTENCPKCGGKWKCSDRTETVDFICNDCRLATDDPTK